MNWIIHGNFCVATCINHLLFNKQGFILKILPSQLKDNSEILFYLFQTYVSSYFNSAEL